MIRALSLAAALALLPVSAAVAQENKTSAEVQLEAAAAAFEKKMEEFGERAEAIQSDNALTETTKGLRVAALWSEYQPHVAAFTSIATQQAGEIAQQALAEVDIEAVVTQAMTGVAPLVQGLAANSAWANPDPDQGRALAPLRAGGDREQVRRAGCYGHHRHHPQEGGVAGGIDRQVHAVVGALAGGKRRNADAALR